MQQENCRKIKLLKIMEILQRESDEAHPMRTSAICEKLRAMDISCDPRTLHLDIKVLNAYGYEVLSTMAGHERAFYILDRSFSIPELKILIDAVQAASFVTDKKTAELIDKIAALGGSNRAAIMKDNIVHFNTRKHSNESIYYNVDTIEEAINSGRKMAFRYFDLNCQGQRAYRKEGQQYMAEPVALVFNEDNYYMIAYHEKHGGTANYRVDRMDRAEVLAQGITATAKQYREQIAAYTESAFKMYGGREETVVIRFKNHLLGTVFDKFGEKTIIRKCGDDEAEATVRVQISPTFWGWLFQFAGRDEMKILAPQSVRDEYKQRMEEAIEEM